MIFLTVGTELPFDRLVRAIDDWAGQQRRQDIFAQIGESGYQPRHFPFAHMMEAPEFKERFAAADLVIAHAGMGTILSALSHGKPLLVMPRRADLGEHRNDHQMATARHLAAQRRIEVAFDEAELITKLDQLDHLQPKDRIAEVASPELLHALELFIADGRVEEPFGAALPTQPRLRRAQ
jgi:UDP-N-acetylglucosamine transferase subunit ALG13